MTRVVVLNGRDVPNGATEDSELVFAMTGPGISFTGHAFAPGDCIEWDFVTQRIDISRTGTVVTGGDEGSITLANTPRDIRDPGPWDDLKEWAWQKREAFLYEVPARVWADRVLVARGILEQPVGGSGKLTFTLRDCRSVLDAPLQPRKFAGDNVAPDGVEGAGDLAGQPEPVLYGLNSNIKPKLVNAQKLIYCVCDKPAEVLCVRDGGLALTLGTIRANVASLEANEPPPGSWDYCSTADGTYFRLGRQAQYELRFDAQEGATAADRTHAQIWKRIRTERCGTDPGDIDDASVDQVDAYDAGSIVTRVQETITQGSDMHSLLTSFPTDGNWLVGFVAYRLHPLVLEAGWTLLGSHARAGQEPHFAIAYRRLGAGEPKLQQAFSSTISGSDSLYVGTSMIELAGVGDDFLSALADWQIGFSDASGANDFTLTSVTPADDAFALTSAFGVADNVFLGAEVIQAGSGWGNTASFWSGPSPQASYIGSQDVSSAGTSVTTHFTRATTGGTVGALLVFAAEAVEVGFYAAEETTQRAFLDEVLGSLSGYETRALDASWSIHRLDRPSGDPDLSIVQVREDQDFAMTATDRKLAGEPERARPSYAPDGAPPYRVSVNWGHCQDTMTAADFAGHPLLAPLREKFSKPWRTVTATSTEVWDPTDGSGAFPGAPELTINTGHQPGRDGVTCPKAGSEARRLLALYGGLPVKSQYVVPFVLKAGDPLAPGTKVGLTWAGDGLDTGGLFIALQARHTENADGASTTMILGLQA